MAECNRAQRPHDEGSAKDSQGKQKRRGLMIAWKELLCDRECKVTEYNKVKPLEGVAGRDCYNNPPFVVSCSNVGQHDNLARTARAGEKEFN